MGLVEAELEAEAQRRWLLWRDELLQAGLVDPGELWEALVARQRAWETAPQSDLGGMTPVEAIETEREARSD